MQMNWNLCVSHSILLSRLRFSNHFKIRFLKAKLCSLILYLIKAGDLKRLFTPITLNNGLTTERYTEEKKKKNWQTFEDLFRYLIIITSLCESKWNKFFLGKFKTIRTEAHSTQYTVHSGHYKSFSRSLFAFFIIWKQRIEINCTLNC